MDILLEENKSNGNKSPVITDNISNIELDEINSYGNETIKVRKPYTITKQRERWTEEEHTKFVEGLQLYGRGWRRIEEHIGTKTAVQIRSHAQKFFSKMARDASSDQLKIAKAIEIPPPRPKRKPSHPYPRKLGNSLNQRIPFFKQIGLQTLLKTSMSEQGRTSPTSVLLTNGPDDQSPSFLQSLQDNCNSPVKSAGGSPPSPGLANTGDKYIESYRIPCGKMASQEVSAEAATIRLFGKTLPLADAPKPSHPSAASIVPDITPSSLLKAVTQHVSGTTSEHGSSTLTMQGCNYVPLSFNLVGHLPKSYEGGIPLPPYSFVPPGDNSINTSTSHLPWQFFGRTFPSKVMNPQSTNPVSCPPSNCIEALSSHETPKEGSCSGSCTTCHNGITISGHDVDAADSKKADNLKKHEQSPCSLLKLSDTLTFRSRKLGLDEPRTSLRCKRFRAEREAQPIAATEDVESPTFRLCL